MTSHPFIQHFVHPLTPDAARAARVREKCRTRLESRNRRASLLEPVIVGGFSILYVLAIVIDTLALGMG
jgi:hypothetical protein